ncbi:Trehalose-6-P synthase/phosphatase complex subunit [Lithohypha guttulata]|uniref:Trehalose-6-P synthase/phosphatase complex subunit n=1 Tax=Lithohypha guttulata TaxID=1690604 RepID=A0AAN7T6H0_9EURO|nr:Trehalose-6-P synthase/phosphatase complex subunit [Lithohypha guttulata]KAK5090544.1 Trehalose-6-P synthase/phosphatase complex subunit [Lithohypha guttulata]KAK5104658.1 Trehalose-6-P synthase/phosphatase complex subunit [Lithohypha guttulata]
MVLLLAALTVPNTVAFHSLSDVDTTPTVSTSSKKEEESGQDYTTFNPHKDQQHARSQSLQFAPSLSQIGPIRAPAALAKTPGATTNLEDFFKPQNFQVVLPKKALIRNKSATSLQALVASEYQTKSWGKIDEVNQPQSLAESPPSQSIFEDTAISKDPIGAPPETSRTTPRTKIARRKKRDVEYTTSNYTIQPTTLGNAGLFSAITAIEDKGAFEDFFWVGTLGMPTDRLPQDVKEDITDKFLNDLDTFLVFLNDTDMNGHYENYCKNILFPMLHSQVPDVPKSKAYQDNSWSHYKKVNEAFADTIIKNYKEGDVVWVHDYHLLLVPNLVREKYPRAQIEIFRNLPSRLDLIAGMLGANMIGFQTEDFRYQFLQTCSRLLNIEATDHGLVLENGRFIDVFGIPMGIDINTMNMRRQLSEVKDNMKELSERFAGKHVIVSRDKLDGIHGLKHKLRGFAEFLDQYPQWEDKVVLVQIATSATQDIELRDTVNNLITEINGDWGDLNHQPIVYLNQEIDYPQYLALMSIADCMLVTSLSEGMNLTCHEFVVCQDGTSSLKGYAPLVCSEFIGAAKVFDSNTILVNPWHPRGIAAALDKALSMSHKERKQRWQQMFEVTQKYCAEYWFKTFTQSLEHAWKAHNARDPSTVPRLQMRELRKKYAVADKRLLVVDFEGTLTTWDSPKEPVITVPLKVIAMLNELLEDQKNIVYVMSEQSMDALQHMFRNVRVKGALPDAPSRLGLVAENGAFIRKPNTSEWTELVKLDISPWRKGVMDILGHYTTSIPGSSIKEIRSGIIFSYADAADHQDASHKAGELANQINEMCENLGVSATPTEKGLYIAPNHIDKRLACKAIEKEFYKKGGSGEPDFILVFGDSYEDECVFEWAHGIQDRNENIKVNTTVVGKRSTLARSAITQGPSGVLAALEKLAMVKDSKAA